MREAREHSRTMRLPTMLLRTSLACEGYDGRRRLPHAPAVVALQ